MVENMENNALVSVIIPVFNVEKYIRQCVDSVIGQTYQNIEIILVDDGSEDSCPQICDEYACKDLRIKVIHKVNGGLGHARNSGLSVAEGDYVYFLDSDDYLIGDAIERLLTIALAESADIVGSGVYRIEDCSTQKDNYYCPEEYRVYRDKEINETFIPDIIAKDPKTGHKVGFWMNISGPFFSHSFLKNQQWKCASEREIISEDIYSFLKMCECLTCAVEAPVYTCVCRVNPNSLTHTYDPYRFEKNISFYLKCLELCDSMDMSLDVRKRLARPFFSNVISLMKQELKRNNRITDKLNFIKKICRNSILGEAINTYDFATEKIAWKVLFTLIKKRCYWLIYIVVRCKA